MTDLWSVNALAEALEIDRRTVKKRLRDVPPAGERGGHPVWKLADAVAAITQPAKDKPAKAQAPEPPPGFSWLAGLPPTDAIAALALMTLVYRLPPALASLAVHSGASCREAYTVAEVSKVALVGLVQETGRDLGLHPWASESDPSFACLELFSEIDWPGLAEIAGEPLEPERWAEYARQIAA